MRNSTLIEKRKLGGSDLMVSAIGLGCMGMSEFYGTADEAESLATLNRALDIGLNFFDTSNIYGPYKNERLLSKVVSKRRDEVVLATKFGIHRTEDGQFVRLNGEPDYVRSACDASLKRLGVDTIDLYYQHRVDPSVPIEETVGAMAELVKAGKVRYLGLSEASPEIIRRAHKVHPITALQTEYSLWSREPEGEILATTRELGISFVAYSPLGRGFLADRFDSLDDLEPGDWRLTNPRFQADTFQKNLHIREKVKAFAKKKGVTPAQLALAWVIAQGQDIVTIPGTKRISYLEQNAAAMSVVLTPQEIAELNEIAPQGVTVGEKY